MKNRAALLPVRRLDRPAKPFDDRMTNREPQPSPLPRRLGRHKRIEHLLDNLTIDPRPIILDD